MRVRILAVEDSPTQAEQLRHVLEEGGYEVIAAANGSQALSEARQHPPIAVISDIVMPEMDGYTLCKAVDPTTRIVLLAGWADEIGPAAHQRGCVDQIAGKPLDLAALAPLIAAAPVREPG